MQSTCVFSRITVFNISDVFNFSSFSVCFNHSVLFYSFNSFSISFSGYLDKDYQLKLCQFLSSISSNLSTKIRVTSSNSLLISGKSQDFSLFAGARKVRLSSAVVYCLLCQNIVSRHCVKTLCL